MIRRIRTHKPTETSAVCHVLRVSLSVFLSIWPQPWSAGNGARSKKSDRFRLSSELWFGRERVRGYEHLSDWSYREAFDGVFLGIGFQPFLGCLSLQKYARSPDAWLGSRLLSLCFSLQKAYKGRMRRLKSSALLHEMVNSSRGDAHH